MRRYVVRGVAVAVAGAVLVACGPRDEGGRSTVPSVRAAPAPEWFLALANGQPRLFAAEGTRQLEVPFDVHFEPETTAAAGDGRTFYVGLLRDCRSRFLKVTVTDGRVRTSTVPGDVTGGQVFGLAVSQDGRRLAYAVFRPAPGTRCNGGDRVPELVVRDLGTGATRTWTARASEPARYVGSLSFSPDGQRLAYDVAGEEGSAVHVLDTAAPGGSFVTDRPIGQDVPAPPSATGPCGLGAPAYRGTTGQLLAVRFCGSSGRLRHAVDVVMVDPAGGRLLGPLFDLPEEGAPVDRLEPDASGGHVFAESTASDGEAVFRWDGAAARPVEPRPGSHVAW